LPGYLGERFGEEKLDHILDCVGTQALYANSPKYLKPEGRVVNVGGFEGLVRQLYNWIMNTWWPRWLGGTPRRYIMFSTPPLREPGLELIKLMDEGKIRVPLESEWKFDDLIEAYDRIESKRTRGKIIIAV
jgi:NADPH:quinone reductase-like Zn-dependent oxidoreductase